MLFSTVHGSRRWRSRFVRIVSGWRKNQRRSLSASAGRLARETKPPKRNLATAAPNQSTNSDSSAFGSLLPLWLLPSYINRSHIHLAVPSPQENPLLPTHLILASRIPDMEQPAACAPPPARAPVPVAWSVVPVDFTVVKKGPEMAMHDATGALAFRVSGGGAGGTALFDAAGVVLVTVRTCGQGEWQAFSGSSLEQRHIIFSAKVISTSSSRKEVYVFIPPRSSFEDPKPSYRLLGSTFRRACTVIKGDSIVAQTNLLYKLKKTIYSRRKFRVTIYPGHDNILVMAMIMTFFVEK